MADLPNKKKFESQFSILAGLLGVFTSVMLVPIIFERTLAVDKLLAVERTNLWIFSSLLFLLSIFLILFNKKNKINLALSFFVVILLIGTELTTRVFVNLFSSKQTINELTNYVNRTYPQFFAFDGHPFTSFMGKSSKTLVGTEITGGFKPFNNFGFVGDDFTYQKIDGTIRIAALGASTTARGYPAMLEDILNKSVKSGCRFEVMNFGVTGWTTAHTMVNFLLNVLDFNPDYIIIHHGWNENKVRNYPANVFRGDYSHTFTYFHEPEIADKIPLRTSVIYRLLKMRFSKSSMPSWMFVGKSTSIVNENPVSPPFTNLDELKPFQRNIESIIEVALSRNIRVILTSQPYSSNPEVLHFSAAIGIEQTNEIMRGIVKHYQDQTLYVELDTLMTGKVNDLFVDVGHLNDEGKYLKANYIAKHIIADSSWYGKACNSSVSNPFFSGLTAREILLVKYFKNKLARESGIQDEDLLWEEALSQYHLLSEDEKQQIFQIASDMKSNAGWYRSTVSKAKNRYISIDEMIIIDAMAIYSKKKK